MIPNLGLAKMPNIRIDQAFLGECMKHNQVVIKSSVC